MSGYFNWHLQCGKKCIQLTWILSQAGDSGSYSLVSGSAYECWYGTSILMSTRQYWAFIGLATCRHSSKSPSWYLLPDSKPTACFADASHTVEHRTKYNDRLVMCAVVSQWLLSKHVTIPLLRHVYTLPHSMIISWRLTCVDNLVGEKNKTNYNIQRRKRTKFITSIRHYHVSNNTTTILSKTNAKWYRWLFNSFYSY